MRRTLLLSFALISGSVALTAQNIERVYTKTGDIYEGFISEQVPGEYIAIFAEKATITVPTRELANIRNDYRPFNTLSESAKDWFRENEDTIAVMLTSFEIEKQYVDNVLIISKDNKETKFVTFANKTYQIPWDSLRKTSKSFDLSIPYGTHDIVTLNTGERLTGCIIEQTIGESLTVKTEDGAEHNVLADDVLSVRSEVIDDEVGLWRQTQMLDRIFIDGDEAIEGFIVSRVMGQKLNIMKLGTNVEQSVPLSDIQKYQKFWNKDFVQYEPPVIDTSKVVKINGNEVKLAKTFEDASNYYVSDSLSVIVKAGEDLMFFVQNYSCERTAQIFRTEPVKILSRDDAEHYGKTYPAVKLDADPIYESAFVKDDENHDVCNIVIRKKGVYILSFKDLKSVIVIDAK